jgi:hypothetical protein
MIASCMIAAWIERNYCCIGKCPPQGQSGLGSPHFPRTHQSAGWFSLPGTPGAGIHSLQGHDIVVHRTFSLGFHPTLGISIILSIHKMCETSTKETRLSSKDGHPMKEGQRWNTKTIHKNAFTCYQLLITVLYKQPKGGNTRLLPKTCTYQRKV